jgi:hypothetical protein
MSKKMTEAEVVAVVKSLLEDSTGFTDDKVTRDREKALDYYFMRPRGDEQVGRSQVISGDLSSMVEAVLSQTMDAFSTDKVVEFEPTGKDDEDQAQLESDTVTHFVMDANNGYIHFLAAIKDALLLRNGIIKVWVDETRDTEIQEYDNVDPIAFERITTQPNVIVDVLEYDLDNETLQTRETTINRKLRVEAIPIENFLYTRNWTSIDLADVPFCGELRQETRSSLIAQGFSKQKVNDLKGIDRADERKQAIRNPAKDQEGSHTTDRSMDIIEYYECYALIDTDGDGVAERRRILIADTTILEDKEVEEVPYGAGVALVNAHRFLGVSLYDKLKQIQDINTGLNRALLDNANATNKSRLLVRDGKVNPDDLNDGRVNGNIRVAMSHQGPLQDAAAPLMVPDISQGILLNIQHQKQTRSELGGASLELASGQAQLGSAQIGSQGLDRAYSVMEQLSAMMAKIIAETLVRSVYLLTHSTLRRYFDQPVNIRRSGKWDSPVPSEWQKRERLNVKIGMSAGERGRKVAILDNILNKQVQFSEGGLDDILVNSDGFYSALMDWARAAEIDNPEQYFLDPASEDSQKAMASKQAQAQQAKQQQAALMDQALGLEQLRVAFEKYKQDSELQFKYWNANLDSEVEEAKIVGKATQDLASARQPEKEIDDDGKGK